MNLLDNWKRQQALKKELQNSVIYKLNIQVSFETVFFIRYEKEKGFPVIKEFIGSNCEIETFLPDNYIFQTLVYVVNNLCKTKQTFTVEVFNTVEADRKVEQTFKVGENHLLNNWEKIVYDK